MSTQAIGIARHRPNFGYGYVDLLKIPTVKKEVGTFGVKDRQAQLTCWQFLFFKYNHIIGIVQQAQKRIRI